MADIRELLAREISYTDEGCASTDTWDQFCKGDESIKCECRDKADAILAALKVNGLVIVPREPTAKMEDAWGFSHEETAKGDWSVMLAASPYWEGE